MYRSYRTLVYGKKVEGKSKGTVPDWTRSMIVIPAFAITFSWRPEGSEVDEQTTWKGLPGERCVVWLFALVDSENSARMPRDPCVGVELSDPFLFALWTVVLG